MDGSVCMLFNAWSIAFIALIALQWSDSILLFTYNLWRVSMRHFIFESLITDSRFNWNYFVNICRLIRLIDRPTERIAYFANSSICFEALIKQIHPPEARTNIKNSIAIQMEISPFSHLWFWWFKEIYRSKLASWYGRQLEMFKRTSVNSMFIGMCEILRWFIYICQ